MVGDPGDPPTGVRRSRRVRALVAAVTIALLVSACGSGGEDEDATDASLPNQTGVGDPVAGGTLTYGIPAETNGWDPTLSQWGPWSLVVARTIFDTLSVFDDQGNVHPYLAESFTPNDDYYILALIAVM